MAAGPRLSGWRRAAGKGDLQLYHNGTLVGTVTATNLGLPLAPTLALAATTTITAGTGVTVTTGNNTNTAGDHRVTAGNVRLGAVEVFATTEPT
jgi:adhesin HecA-like repeat protein